MPNAPTPTNNRGYIGFTIGTAKYEFKGKISVYSPLKSILGLDHVQENHKEGYSERSTRELVKDGLIMVLTVQGTSSNKSKTGKLNVPIDKASTAIPDLPDKAYGGWQITRAYQSGDRSMRY